MNTAHKNLLPSFFTVQTQEGAARRGVLALGHGLVETPAFMPVGTRGNIKGIAPSELSSIGYGLFIANSYHLYIRPGMEIFQKLSLEKKFTLHDFVNWDGNIATDSGGFQIFSLPTKNIVTNDGVWFQSLVDGRKHLFTPELSCEIQEILGSDIAMVLDHCVSYKTTQKELTHSVELSHAWLKRFLTAKESERSKGPSYQKVFGIVQGGLDKELRIESLERTCGENIDGLALGGLSVGESFEERVDMLSFLSSRLSPLLPHYLMGVGTPIDILEAVYCGIDLFDCVLPSRNARNGSLFVHETSLSGDVRTVDKGVLHIRNSAYKSDPRPVSSSCPCYLCTHFSRSYLRHLFQSNEMLGYRLATLHNLTYYNAFMVEIRNALSCGTFTQYYQETKKKLI